jgi:hypothetical protein
MADELINSIVPPRRMVVSFLMEVDGDRVVERMHATDAGNGRLVLDNSPFHVFAVSFGDTITAAKRIGSGNSKGPITASLVEVNKSRLADGARLPESSEAAATHPIN